MPKNIIVETILFKLLPICVVYAVFSTMLVQADTLDLTRESRTSVGLAIYNENLALVNDAYTAGLPAGQSTLNFSAVSPLINHASAVLHPLPETLRVLEQYFRDAMTPEGILANSVGQMVSLVTTHPASGEQTHERARILSVSGGIILEIDGAYETGLAGRRVVYDQLPHGVFSPTLSIGVDSTVGGRPDLILSYLTGGLSWQADYVAQLNSARDSIQLRAMASISNHSGVDFQAANIELIAGSVNRVQANIKARRELAMTASMDSGPSVTTTSLADLYLYTLPRPVDLTNNSARQVMLFEAREVPVEQTYQLDGQANVYYSPNVPEQKLGVDSFIEFSNNPDQHLGMPMPAGVVRVYAQARAQPHNLQFIGEDRLGHTPANTQVRLKIGKAFDLGGTRKQIAYHRLPVEAPFRHHSEAEIRIELGNARSEPVVVRVQENFSGEWTLVDGPKPIDIDAHSGRWDLVVPAQGNATLNLTVRVKR